jgi:hypothetical protein
MSLGAFKETTAGLMPRTIGVFMGDLTDARGVLGKKTAEAYYRQVLPETGMQFVCAGVGELQFGSVYVRDALRRLHDSRTFAMLCANAVAPNGRPVLQGSEIARAAGVDDLRRRNVLVVAVAAASLQDELVARGSDIILQPEAEAASAALADGRNKALEYEIGEIHSTVLLVQGTVDEAAAVVEAVPGFDFAVAARGPVLPEIRPRMVGDVSIFYAGQGMRFGWRVSVDGKGPKGVYGSLVRFGSKLMSLGSRYAMPLDELARFMSGGALQSAEENPEERPAHPGGTFVGAEACRECHPEEFRQHRDSAHWRSPAELMDTEYATSTSCMPCHVTQPFFRGGWSRKVPFEDFGGISCESCHGPGAEHVAAPEQEGWGKTDLAACTRCHLPERSPGFDAEVVWRDFGHALAKPEPPKPPAPPGKEREKE